MSAVVCGGKRSNSIFDEHLHTSPSKRIRCSAGTSPTRSSLPKPSIDNNNTPLARLIALFPEMDQQILGRTLEESGNDFDSAIKSLNDLRLGTSENNEVYSVRNEIETNVHPSTEGVMSNGGGDAVSESQLTTDNVPTDGSQWVDLLVREMMAATDVDDARARASRVLHVLEQSIIARAGADATRSLHKENMMLKEQAQVLLRENTILKRAVAIQHERQREHDNGIQELQHLKQLVSQCQEQIRTLELNNYALRMHLQQAQQSSSIPGRFNPDVF